MDYPTNDTLKRHTAYEECGSKLLKRMMTTADELQNLIWVPDDTTTLIYHTLLGKYNYYYQWLYVSVSTK